MRFFSLLFVFPLVGLYLGCQDPAASSGAPSAHAVIDSAIAAHGRDTLDRASVSFLFRDAEYQVTHRNGRFHYRRRFVDSTGRSVVEGLMNDGPYRVVDGDTTTLSPNERHTIDTDVNSVAYFSLLPYRLDDPAVEPTYVGRDTIDGQPYHCARVTFREEGGGQDWQDVFVYWFQTDTYAMDFFAYAYGLGPDEDAGTRFREAYNVRRVGGVRITDYRNYTVDTLAPDQLVRYPELRANDRLELVSHVELDSVRVRPLSPSR